MALTVLITKQWKTGDRTEVLATVTGDSSYANAGGGTHGESLTASDLGLDIQLDYCEPIGLMAKSDNTSAFAARYNATTAKLEVYKANGTTDLTPVANAVDLSTYSVVMHAVGKGKVAV